VDDFTIARVMMAACLGFHMLFAVMGIGIPPLMVVSEGILLIAQAPAWTRQREWEKYPEQASAPVALEAGRRYYIEVLHKEGDQSDNLAVAWQVPGRERDVIAGEYLDAP
jgi:hypothetical protein